jgi:adenosine deaminase
MFNEEIFKAAISGDLALLRAVPKTDLHSHSVLACSKPFFRQLSQENFVDPPKSFGSLDSFLGWVGRVLGPVTENPALGPSTLADALSVLHADGVTYAELSIHLPLARMASIPWTFLASELLKVVEASPVDVRLELGIPRTISQAELERDAAEAIETEIFSGIDIYDDELFCPLDRFLPIIHFAKNKGLYVKVHTGEVGGPEQIKRDIKIAGPDVIQHGVRIAEDTRLMDLVKERGTPLNICPSSNLSLGVVRSLKEHPIRKLFDHGIRVTVNTDDYLAFQQTVSDEYLNLYREGVFSAQELEQIRLEGLSRQIR